ncbi:MAG TPA: DUF5979 domain-containing protein, partial [Ilumatobacter sp.]
YSATTLTVLAGQTSTTTVTNTYVQQLAPPGLGSVIVNKIVSGDPPPTTYYVGLVGPAPATTERWLTVTGAGEVTFAAMPVGTYTVVERDPGTHYTVTISPTTVAVTTDGVARATVTNAFSEIAPSVGTLPRSGAGATPLIATVAATLLLGGTALTAVGHRRRVS